jgi:hypothetical protein
MILGKINIISESQIKASKGSVLLITLFLLSIFVTLSFFFERYFANLLLTDDWNDFWFGADIQRHIDWATDHSKFSRGSRHPISLGIFKFYGLVLTFMGVFPKYAIFPIISLPVTLFTSFTIAYSVRTILPERDFSGWVQILGVIMLVLIGSTLTFAHIPESHTFGGSTLLLQVILTWRFLKKYSDSDIFEHQRNKTLLFLSIFGCAAIATGFTLSNLMPAIILLLAIPHLRERLFTGSVLRTVVFSFAVITFIVLIHSFIMSNPFLVVIQDQLRGEIHWMRLINSETILLSFKNFLISQFGMGFTNLVALSENGKASIRVIPSTTSHIQIVAFICYVGTLIVWAWKNRKIAFIEVNFLLYCTAAFLSLLLFHSFYAVDEAYIFSAHGWPFLVVPGLIVLRKSWLQHEWLPILFIILTVALCALQTILGLQALLQLKLPF